MENSIQVDDVETLIEKFRKIIGVAHPERDVSARLVFCDLDPQRQRINADDAPRFPDERAGMGREQARASSHVEHSFPRSNIELPEQELARFELAILAHALVEFGECWRIESEAQC